MRVLTLIPTLATASLLAGCAIAPATLQGYQAKPPVTGFKLVDARLKEDKTSERLSMMITSCDYGVARLGDEVTVPSRLVLLEQDLGEQLGNKLQDVALELAQYRVHTNEAVVFRQLAGAITAGSVAAGALGATVADTMTSIGSRCSKEEMRGGWYAGSEITEQRSPIIFEISIRWNGKSLAMRKVYTPKRYFTAAFGDPNHAATLFDAIHEAHVELAKQITTAQ